MTSSSSDIQHGAGSSSIRILAINLQIGDLDSSTRDALNTLSPCLSVEWGASPSIIETPGDVRGYDLVLVGDGPRLLSVSQAAAFKESSETGLVVLVGDADSCEEVRSHRGVGVWGLCKSQLGMCLPLLVEQGLERQRLLAAQAWLGAQLNDVEARNEVSEMANVVLHNVGNVLNSVNVTGKVLEDLATQSSVVLINRMAELLKGHEEDWVVFLSDDPKGKRILPLLKKLGGPLLEEQEALLREIQGLRRRLSHIRQVIVSHQTMAKVQGVTSPIDLHDLVDQAIELSFQAEDSRWLVIKRDFCPVPSVLVEPTQILQILVNIFRNAKQAMQQCQRESHTLSLAIRSESSKVCPRITLTVEDSGVGIAPENLQRMFTRGFTTKKEGNGIGLHSSARTLEKLGGSLSVQSGGVGCGATFTLVLPVGARETIG